MSAFIIFPFTGLTSSSLIHTTQTPVYQSYHLYILCVLLIVPAALITLPVAFVVAVEAWYQRALRQHHAET
jgi:hypothetical protein